MRIVNKITSLVASLFVASSAYAGGAADFYLPGNGFLIGQLGLSAFAEGYRPDKSAVLLNDNHNSTQWTMTVLPNNGQPARVWTFPKVRSVTTNGNLGISDDGTMVVFWDGGTGLSSGATSGTLYVSKDSGATFQTTPLAALPRNAPFNNFMIDSTAVKCDQFSNCYFFYMTRESGSVHLGNTQVQALMIENGTANTNHILISSGTISQHGSSDYITPIRLNDRLAIVYSPGPDLVDQATTTTHVHGYAVINTTTRSVSSVSNLGARPGSANASLMNVQRLLASTDGTNVFIGAIDRWFNGPNPTGKLNLKVMEFAGGVLPDDGGFLSGPFTDLNSATGADVGPAIVNSNPNTIFYAQMTSPRSSAATGTHLVKIAYEDTNASGFTLRNTFTVATVSNPSLGASASITTDALEDIPDQLIQMIGYMGLDAYSGAAASTLLGIDGGTIATWGNGINLMPYIMDVYYMYTADFGA